VENLYQLLLNLGVDPEKARENIETFRSVVDGIIYKGLSENSPINLSVANEGLIATYGRLKITFAKDGIYVSPVEGCSCWKEDDIRSYRYRDERKDEVHTVIIPQPPNDN